MENLKIIEAGNAAYLNEIEGFKDLPTNCLFNKVITGCGGTTVALQSEKPYVICVPFITLIENKKEYCNSNNIEAVYVYQGSKKKENEISEFTEADIATANKILVTYDSLPKVVNALAGRVKEFSLLVDEYHLLTKSGNFRYKAINQVLRLFKHFKEYTFMTATPVKKKYLPEVLKDIPEVKMKWNNIVPVNLNYTVLPQKELYYVIAHTAYRHTTKENYGNGYFFINSVRSIIKILKYLEELKVNPTDIRVITGNKEENQMLLDNELKNSYKIGKPSDFPREINFITSTAFEGVDFFDENGVTYIVSDGTKDHTKNDVITTIPQIIGRIRNQNEKFRNKARVIFSPSPYFSYTTLEEFEAFALKEMAKAKRAVEDFYSGSLGDFAKEAIKEYSKNSAFVEYNDETDSLDVSDTAIKSEMSNYETVNSVYYVKTDSDGIPIQREGTRTKKINDINYNFNSISREEIEIDKVDLLRLGVGRKNFQELCDIYENLNYPLQILGEADQAKKKLIEKYYPLIPKAFDVIGYDKIKALEYNRKDILAEVAKVTSLSQPLAVLQQLDTEYTYRKGRKVSLAEVKADLQEAFTRLRINRTAKATDLKHLFEVRETKTVRDGQRVRGYRIIGCKVKY